MLSQNPRKKQLFLWSYRLNNFDISTGITYIMNYNHFDQLGAEEYKKNKQALIASHALTRIIHAISFVQMRGVGTRRYIFIFQGFRNEADVQR